MTRFTTLSATIAALVLSAGFLFTSSVFAAGPQTVVINEFVSDPSSGSEWVELYNTTGSEIDLTDWHVEDAASHALNLSGTIAANGFATFDFSGNILNNGGDSLTLIDNASNTINSVAYGTESGAVVAAPALGYSAARSKDGGTTWATTSWTTKGTTNVITYHGAINFESYTDGSVNGQDGWSSTGSFDQGIVDTSLFGSPTGFGTKAFRLSNAIVSGGFGNQTFVTPLADSVGEVSATVGSFSEATRYNHYELQFDVAAATTTEQPGLFISISPDRGDGSRMSYIGLSDDTDGTHVIFYDVQGVTNPADFVPTDVATLDRAVAHTIKLSMDTYDGASNDIVKVYVDGSLVHTGTSWENYYRFDNEANAEQSPRIVKTAIFRAGGSAAPSTSGKGFLFDNVSLAASALPDTSTVTSGSLSDIQDALATLPTGGTLQVSGSYTGDLLITRPVTIMPVSGETASFTGKITVASNDVTLSGLDITNPDAGYGIVINGKSNVSVTGNTVHDIGTNLTSGSAQAIYLVGGTGAAITGTSITSNTITNVGTTTLAFGTSGSAKGIYIGDTSGTGTITGLIVSDNIITNVTASAATWPVGRGAYGIAVNFGGATTATISGNTIDNLAGLWSHAIGLEGNTPNTTVSGNTITNLSDNKGGTDEVAVRLEDNVSASTVVISNNTFDGTSVSNVASAVVVDGALSTANAYAEVVENGSIHYVGMNAFATIASAVSAVTTGGTVSVAAGTYTESPTLSKALTLTSVSGAVGTTITGQITVSAADVTVKNLTVTNPSGNFGVLVVSVSNATVSGNTITNIGTIAATGNAYGLYFQSHTTTNVSNVVFTGNTVNGVGTTTSYSNGGIGIGDSTGSSVLSNFTVSDNTISNINAKTAVSGGKGAYGIHANHASPAAGGTTTGLHITGNTISGLTGKWAHAIGLEGGTPNAVVTGNTVSGLTATDNGGNFDAEAVRIEDNTGAATLTINGNSFDVATTVWGILNNYANSIVNATQNFWGLGISNPASYSAGVASGASVLVTPWYTDAAMTTLNTGTPTVSGSEASTTIPVAINQNGSSTQNGSVVVSVAIPSGTVITGNASWDGTLQTPTATTTTIAVAGYTSTVTSAIAIGSSDSDFTFDNAVRLSFAGQAGTLVGWYDHAGVFTEITDSCAADDQTTENGALAAAGSCKIDVGGDLVVWTKHFSTFVTYTTSLVAPVLSPNGFVFHGSVDVTMDYVSGTSIRYTTDGTDPTCSTGNGYADGQVLTFSGVVTLKAMRCDGGGAPTASSIVSAVFSPATGGGSGGGGSSSGSGSTGGSSAGATGGSTGATAGSTGGATAGSTGSTGGVVLGAATFNFSKNLSFGSTGADATELQKLLMAAGFDIPLISKSGVAYGFFGPQTKAAVIAYQKAHNIVPAVGFVGPITRAELNKGVVATTPEHTTNLTTTQAQSILSLIESFGADASVIASVKASLGL